MATQTASRKAAVMKPRYDGKKLSLEKFFDFKAEDGFKYEWNNGFLEARGKMKQSEVLLIEKLREVFQQTKLRKARGVMTAETICPISEGKYRIPDVSVFTKAQMEHIAEGSEEVPVFVIEFVSPSDRFNYYDEKLDEYFSVGVQCVWLISPAQKKIRVFTSPTDVKINVGSTRCTAAPALADFIITPDDLFA
jgi:Uma2 family endonuclease